MKNISILLLILASACHTSAPTTSTKTDSTAGTKNPASVQKINFNTSSRGYQKNILFTKDSVVLVVNSSFPDNPSKDIRTRISATEWDKLTASLTGVEISKINDLTSPTMKRAVDGANHSAIMILTDKEYSHSFDDYNPNEQLKKLMDVIQEIEKGRNK